jgi:hypothetical protein
MEIASGEERNFRVQMGIRQRTIPNSTSSYPTEHSKVRAVRALQWAVKRSFGHQQNSKCNPAKSLLGSGKKRNSKMMCESVTPVRPVAAHGVKCSSKTLGRRSKGQ